VIDAGTMELVIQGDVSQLSPVQRVQYYVARCQAAGLDPATRPFDLLKTRDGKYILYPNANACQQKADQRGINLDVRSREVIDDLFVVTMRGVTRDHRSLERMGAVSLAGLHGQAKADAMMKAETKAARRVVLGLTGLAGSSDDDLPTGVTAVQLDPETGELIEPAATREAREAVATCQAAFQELAAEWERQEFDPDDLPGLQDYVRRALARPLTSKSDPLGRAQDLSAVRADLCDRPLALKAAMAAYREAGGDPHAVCGDLMRADMERLFSRPVESRRHCTSRELRLFADACKERMARPAAPEADLEDLPGYDDPFQDD
jgi:hypothetical protein